MNDGRHWAAVMLLTGALGAAWIWASAVPASATSGSFRRRCSATWYWWGWWPTLDALAPGLAAFSIAVGFAHLASGDAFGTLRLAQLVSLLVLLAAMAGLRMRTAIVERR